MDTRIAGGIAALSLGVLLTTWAAMPGTDAPRTAPEPLVHTPRPATPPLPVRPVGDTPSPPPATSTLRRPDPQEFRQQFEQRQAAVWDRMDDMVAAGELSAQEAEALRAITQRTFSRIDPLIDQRDAGELGAIGMLLHTIPVRIMHVTEVVGRLGITRMREVGPAWRARR